MKPFSRTLPLKVKWLNRELLGSENAKRTEKLLQSLRMVVVNYAEAGVNICLSSTSFFLPVSVLLAKNQEVKATSCQAGLLS